MSDFDHDIDLLAESLRSSREVAAVFHNIYNSISLVSSGIAILALIPPLVTNSDKIGMRSYWGIIIFCFACVLFSAILFYRVQSFRRVYHLIKTNLEYSQEALSELVDYKNQSDADLSRIENFKYRAKEATHNLENKSDENKKKLLKDEIEDIENEIANISELVDDTNKKIHSMIDLIYKCERISRAHMKELKGMNPFIVAISQRFGINVIDSVSHL
jgi:hypothetical protein